MTDETTAPEVDSPAKQLAIIMTIAQGMNIEYPEIIAMADKMMKGGIEHRDDMRLVMAAALTILVFVSDNFPQFKRGLKLSMEAIANEISLVETGDLDS